jgi:alpha-L-fucosidase 2
MNRLVLLFAGFLLLTIQTSAVCLDWKDYLSHQDPDWERLPNQWWAAPFLGNGMMGTMIRQDGPQSIRWDVDRCDVQEHRPPKFGSLLASSRLPIGYFSLLTVGTIISGTMHLDLWNAEARGEIKTTAGSITFRSIVHADEMIIFTEIERNGGEAGARWQWNGLEALCPRMINKPLPPGYEKNPPFVVDESMKVKTCTQSLIGGGETTTAWFENDDDRKATLYISVAHTFPTSESTPTAVSSIDRARAEAVDSFLASHRVWWHHFYSASFLSIPDSYWESFYWIQLYKLASATRSDRALIDNQGPWLQPTPWPAAWWNLNVQLTYWLAYPSNHVDLANSLAQHIDDHLDTLIQNVPSAYRADSAGIGTVTGQDLQCGVNTPSEIPGKGGDIGDLTWALQDYWQQYLTTVDDQRLREKFFPVLRRAINFFLPFLKADQQGVLHLESTDSPEYGRGPDCTYSLSLLRWGLDTLIRCSARLHIDDPLLPKWKQTLQQLTPYPQDENGYMIANGVPFNRGHRHFSHLLMVFPLHLVNIDQPDSKALVDKTVIHWQSMGEKTGFSFTGASLMASAYGEGNDALNYLNGLKSFLQPNTLYHEAGPVIETPLSGARAIQEMAMQSWRGPGEDNGVIRIFPAMPDAWADAAMDKMLAEGEFEVSAVRKDGKTLFVRLKSLAGEPCYVQPGLADPVHVSAERAIELKPLKNGIYQLDLRRGEEAVLYSGNEVPSLDILPVTPQGSSNPWGLKGTK